MSDFLTRLAERTLGLGSTVEPSSPSLFAPALDAGPFDVSADVGAFADRDAATEPAAVAAAASVELSARREWRANETQEVTGVFGCGAAPPVASDDAPGPIVRGVAGTVHESVAAALRAEPVPTGPLVEFAVSPRFEARVRREGHAPAPVHVNDSGTDGRGRSERSAAPLRPLVPNGARQVLDAGAVDLSRRAAPEPARPTVRITIGRVEVRAVTQPPPPERPRREADAEEPRLSLGEYLKRGAR